MYHLLQNYVIFILNKIENDFRTPSVNKSLNDSPEKVLLDLTKNSQPMVNINLKA